MHHGCPKNESSYEYKASARDLSEIGCMMENLGCIGTQAVGDCNIRPGTARAAAPVAAIPASTAPRPGSRTRPMPSSRRQRSPASPSACPPTCQRPGSWRWPRCPRPPCPTDRPQRPFRPRGGAANVETPGNDPAGHGAVQPGRGRSRGDA
ncbi:MAG: hypothetical protein R3D63_13175 [Paracoccaceae bacterium]